MRSLARNGMTASQVSDVLHGVHGTRLVKFRYDLLDSTNSKKADLTTVMSASVSNNTEAEIKRTARFTIKDDSTINFLSDRIKPYMKVWIPSGNTWVEFSLGVFLLSSPRKKPDETNAVIREIEAYDQNQVLKDDKVTSAYLVVAGTEFVTAVRTLLEGAGITNHNLAPSAMTLPVDREWEAGTAKLTIINDLLQAMNYKPLWFDEEGVAIAAPFVSPATAASQYDYANNQRSVILAPSVEQELDLFEVPNQWVLVVSQPDRPALKSIYTNTNANSPTSTVSRGRTIVEYRDMDAADQATLDALAARAAFEDSQVYEKVQWESWLMPQHSHGDVYTFTFTGLNASGAKYEETAWEMELSESGRMRHECRRVVTV